MILNVKGNFKGWEGLKGLINIKKVKKIFFHKNLKIFKVIKKKIENKKNLNKYLERKSHFKGSFCK